MGHESDYLGLGLLQLTILTPLPLWSCAMIVYF